MHVGWPINSECNENNTNLDLDWKHQLLNTLLFLRNAENYSRPWVHVQGLKEKKV